MNNIRWRITRLSFLLLIGTMVADIGVVALDSRLYDWFWCIRLFLFSLFGWEISVVSAEAEKYQKEYIDRRTAVVPYDFKPAKNIILPPLS